MPIKKVAKGKIGTSKKLATKKPTCFDSNTGECKNTSGKGSRKKSHANGSRDLSAIQMHTRCPDAPDTRCRPGCRYNHHTNMCHKRWGNHASLPVREETHAANRR